MSFLISLFSVSHKLLLLLLFFYPDHKWKKKIFLDIFFTEMFFFLLLNLFFKCFPRWKKRKHFLMAPQEFHIKVNKGGWWNGALQVWTAAVSSRLLSNQIKQNFFFNSISFHGEFIFSCVKSSGRKKMFFFRLSWCLSSRREGHRELRVVG